MSVMAIPMGLLSPSTSRVSVTREEDVRCDVPVLVSALHMVSHVPHDNLGMLFIDIAAQLADIVCLLLLMLLGWLFFRLMERDRRVAETEDTIREAARKREAVLRRASVGGEGVVGRTIEEEARLAEEEAALSGVAPDSAAREDESLLRGHSARATRSFVGGFEAPSDTDSQTRSGQK